MTSILDHLNPKPDCEPKPASFYEIQLLFEKIRYDEALVFDRYDDEWLVSYLITLPSTMSPYDLFDSVPNGEWRVYWQNRGDDKAIVALGALASSIDATTFPALTGMRVFGGMPFHRESKVNHKTKEWQDLTTSQFILPECETTFNKNGIVNISLRALSRCSDKKKAIILLERVLKKYFSQPFPTTSNANLPLPICQESLPSFTEWQALLKKAQILLEQNLMRKVVLCRKQILTFSAPLTCGQLLSRLQQIDEYSYLFAIGTPSGHSFFGRPPEKLLSWTGKRIELEALAGTRRSDEAGRDIYSRQLMHSTKDLIEHRYVSEYIEQFLECFCDKFQPVERESLIKLKNVQHIKTTYEGICRDDFDPWRLLSELHPTPAVGGSPEAPALAFIQDEEPTHRGWYAGAIGWFNGEQGDFALAIRTGLLAYDQLHIFGGAGIVATSDHHDEWLETQIKMSNILNLFTTKKDPQE